MGWVVEIGGWDGWLRLMDGMGGDNPRKKIQLSCGRLHRLEREG